MLPTYHDVYIEDVTHRKQTALSKGLFYVSVVMTVLTLAWGFLDRGAFFVCFLFAGLVFFCGRSGERDYELSYTNGTLDIDVIYGKSRRKSLVSVEVEDIVVIAKSKTEPVQKYIGSKMKTYDCISHEEGVTYYCMIIRNKELGSEEKILFEPSEQLLDELWRRAPQKVHK